MNKKISYKKNPRFKINKAPILFTNVRFVCGGVLMLCRRNMGVHKIRAIHLGWSLRLYNSQITKLMGYMRYH